MLFVSHALMYSWVCGCCNSAPLPSELTHLQRNSIYPLIQRRGECSDVAHHNNPHHNNTNQPRRIAHAMCVHECNLCSRGISFSLVRAFITRAQMLRNILYTVMTAPGGPDCELRKCARSSRAHTILLAINASATLVHTRQQSMFYFTFLLSNRCHMGPGVWVEAHAHCCNSL